MKSRFHDWGKVSCFLLYSIISAIYCHKLIDQDQVVVLAELLENGQVVQSAQVSGKVADDTCQIAYSELERQFTTHFDQLSIFSKTLLRNDFKAVAAKEVGCSIELR